MTTSRRSATTRMVVVDPHIDDYRCLVEPARKLQVRLTLTTSGSGALRLAPSFADAVWLVSTRLPDMAGFDLLEMLRSLNQTYRIAVIDNQYEEAHERSALQLGAIQYVCKPVQREWIQAWEKSGDKFAAQQDVRPHPNSLPMPTSTTQFR